MLLDDLPPLQGQDISHFLKSLEGVLTYLFEFGMFANSVIF